MYEVVYFNEEKVMLRKFEVYFEIDNIWYLDNGESNYMIEN